MLAVKQLRTVGAVRASGSARLAVPVGSQAARSVPRVSRQPRLVQRAYNNDQNGLDPDVQAKLDEFQGKIQKWWDEIEDKPTFFLYVGVSVFALTIANQFLRAVDSIPILPNLLKLVGLVYSSWFTYKYLLFAQGRSQLGKDFEQLKEGIAGSVKKSSNSSKVDRDLQEAVSSLKAKASDTTADLNKAVRK